MRKSILSVHLQIPRVWDDWTSWTRQIALKGSSFDKLLKQLKVKCTCRWDIKYSLLGRYDETASNAGSEQHSDLLEEHYITAFLVFSKRKRGQTGHFCDVVPEIGGNETHLWSRDRDTPCFSPAGFDCNYWGEVDLQYAPFNLPHGIVLSFLLSTVLDEIWHFSLHLNKGRVIHRECDETAAVLRVRSCAPARHGSCHAVWHKAFQCASSV